MVTPPPRAAVHAATAGRREWTALLVLLLALLLVSMDVSVLYFAVPFISRELAPSATEQLWIFDIYGFVLGGLLLTMGALGDRIGRRRLLLSGALAFGLASVLAAYATSPEMLIGARALLGVGGATLMPSTLALIRNLFHDARQRATAISIWSAVMVGGVAVGPVISGVLLEHFWWGSVFLVNLPAMVLLLALAPVLVPEFRNPGAGRFDWLSSLLSLAAILPVIYGIKELAADGYAPTSVLALAAGGAVGLYFVHRQRTVTHPLLDLTLFRRPGFGAAVATNLVAMFIMVGFAIFTTQYLQSVLGMSPLRAALWSLVPSLGVGIAAPLSVQLARRINRAYIIGAGFAVAAAGFLALSRLQSDTPLWGILIGAGVYATGVAMVSTLITDLVVGTAPPEQAGAASGLLECVQEFGGALGMALLGSVGTAVYRREFTDAVPSSVPASAVEHARETLGGAVAVSDQLPGQAGEAVLTAARDAFTHGMRTAAVAGLTVSLAAALLSFRRLRHAGATGGQYGVGIGNAGGTDAPDDAAPDDLAPDDAAHAGGGSGGAGDASGAAPVHTEAATPVGDVAAQEAPYSQR
ncbi:MFS transporter [Streptomyces iconiensis]|uniref:MFS transporter n=1 Tax=Streptomyces iconiensis TaxID=1384038 RepID=A0ABT6ZXC1_9ACTN|nr:MFS transporter [Streptomyces iconiensis]MDJ1133709.1 MFS transporter [Streptomyces iconiensis]